MKIDTAVRITKVVQITATVAMVGAIAYANKKASEIDATIAAGEQRIRDNNVKMQNAMSDLTTRLS